MSQASSRFQALYEELHDKMLRVAYRMTGSMDTAEDLVQETFLFALFRQDELLRHPLPEGWLMRTLQNLVLNERRKAAARAEVPLDSLLNLADESAAAPLEEALPRQLSQQDREILIWRFEQDLDYSQIADRLGISETGCRSRVFRAIRRCRDWMK